uniref:Protein kinase domain-containing protein n=1 Tax=Oryza brachyantha TaxID=4533 RepID=J3MBI7_ORYBR
MAPEMIRDHRCDRKVDVYSFGLVLWELTTCLVPFQDLSPVQAAYAVTNAGARPPLSPSCPPAINTLIERCWSAKPEKRPEFKDIVQVLESYDRCLREGLPLLPLPLPLPLPAPAPLAPPGAGELRPLPPGGPAPAAAATATATAGAGAARLADRSIQDPIMQAYRS